METRPTFGHEPTLVMDLASDERRDVPGCIRMLAQFAVARDKRLAKAAEARGLRGPDRVLVAIDAALPTSVLISASATLALEVTRAFLWPAVPSTLVFGWYPMLFLVTFYAVCGYKKLDLAKADGLIEAWDQDAHAKICLAYANVDEVVRRCREISYSPAAQELLADATDTLHSVTRIARVYASIRESAHQKTQQMEPVIETALEASIELRKAAPYILTAAGTMDFAEAEAYATGHGLSEADAHDLTEADAKIRASLRREAAEMGIEHLEVTPARVRQRMASCVARSARII